MSQPAPPRSGFPETRWALTHQITSFPQVFVLLLPHVTLETSDTIRSPACAGAVGMLSFPLKGSKIQCNEGHEWKNRLLLWFTLGNKHASPSCRCFSGIAEQRCIKGHCLFLFPLYFFVQPTNIWTTNIIWCARC